MMKPRDKGHNVVWIEIENHYDANLNTKAAKQINKVLRKLGLESGGYQWNEKMDVYTFTLQDGSFWELPEGGHSFNLDYLAR